MVGASTSEAIEWLAVQRRWGRKDGEEEIKADIRSRWPWIRRPDRQSQKIVEYGTIILEGGHLSKLGNDVWAFLEQVAIAALDVGKIDLAEVSWSKCPHDSKYACWQRHSRRSSQLCVARLNTRFPDSPRVSSLQGMLIEASGELGKALTFYEGILAKDETNLVSATYQV
jgi:hypothetical protein